MSKIFSDLFFFSKLILKEKQTKRGAGHVTHPFSTAVGDRLPFTYVFCKIEFRDTKFLRFDE